MTVMMKKIVLSDPSTPVLTEFSQVISDIIQAAHCYFGEVTYYNEKTKNLLQRIVLSLQGKGLFHWATEEYVKSFSAPSEVLGSDGLNYTCYLGHTSSAVTKPVTGANWTRYWYEGGEGGVAWATDTAYTATGDFLPDSDTLEIQHARIRYANEDYPVQLISEFTYNELPDKQITGRPTNLYFSDKITPRVFLYPQPDTNSVEDYLLILKRTRKLKNIAGDEALLEDFKEVWALALIKSLAYHLALQRVKAYNLDLNWVLILKKDADEAILNARQSKVIKTIQRKEG